MNVRTISVAVLAVNLGLAGTLAYMLVSMQDGIRPAPASPTQFITNTVTQIAVRKINATNHLLGHSSRAHCQQASCAPTPRFTFYPLWSSPPRRSPSERRLRRSPSPSMRRAARP